MTTPEQEQLESIRQRIDALDEKILALISERARCAEKVAQIKLNAGGEQAHFYRPEREAQVLRTVKERNQGPLSDAEMARLFREIMSACLALEQPLRVAYLGPDGSYTHAAALKHFGGSVQTEAAEGIDGVFRLVEVGSADFGVVPVENSTEGVVGQTLDLLLRSPLTIGGEVQLPVHHNLISACSDLAGVETVYGHQQALAQCRKWLDNHLPGVERLAVSSNSRAVTLCKEKTNCGAIAGKMASELYGVPILAANIEDEPNNTTRFLVVGKLQSKPSGEDKTSLLVSTRNQPGALARLLEPLARRGISMSKIESRPSRQGIWEYVFYIDISGHGEDKDVAEALGEIARHAAMIKVLGSYPRFVI